jgi:hypothetical protein
MSNLDQLREEYEAADAAAIKLSGEYHNKVQKAVGDLKERYGAQIAEATQKAAEAQKAYCDAEAAEALKDRPGGAELAEALGLTLPE